MREWLVASASGNALLVDDYDGDIFSFSTRGPSLGIALMHEYITIIFISTGLDNKLLKTSNNGFISWIIDRGMFYVASFVPN